MGLEIEKINNNNNKMLILWNIKDFKKHVSSTGHVPLELAR